MDAIKESVGSIVPIASESAKSVIGLDVGSSSVKVVQLRKEKGKALLETYGEISLGPYASLDTGKATHLNADSIAPAIKDLFNEANVTSSNAGLSIPFSAAMTRIIKMPKMPQDQLQKMIPLEARKFIPMPMNEIVLNWFVIPDKLNFKASPENHGAQIQYMDILLVAVHKDAISNMQSVSKLAALNTSFYELEVFAAVRSSVEYSTTPIMLVDIGSTSTKVYIIEMGIVRFSHLVNFGSQSITENIVRAFSWPFSKAERVKKEFGLTLPYSENAQENKALKDAINITVNRIFTEINRVLINYEKREAKSVSKVILLGAGSNLLGLLDFAQNKLSLDVEKANAFSKIHTPAFLEEVLKEIGPDFAIAAGLALRQVQ